MNYSSELRNETDKDESNQEKLQNVSNEDENKSTFSIVNDLIASSDDNKKEKFPNSVVVISSNATTNKSEEKSESNNLKLSDLITAATTSSSVINTKLEDSEQNLGELYKIYKTPARSIKASKLTSSGGIAVGSESTTPYSSSHSTSSTGITVLENTQTNRSGDFDQDLNLNDFDFCVDEENDGDDEFDESLNLDETSLCDEEFDKTASAKLEEYDSLSQKTLSSSIETFKHEKVQG
jgi:hypothetical protein